MCNDHIPNFVIPPPTDGHLPLHWPGRRRAKGLENRARWARHRNRLAPVPRGGFQRGPLTDARYRVPPPRLAQQGTREPLSAVLFYVSLFMFATQAPLLCRLPCRTRTLLLRCTCTLHTQLCCSVELGAIIDTHEITFPSLSQGTSCLRYLPDAGSFGTSFA